MQADWSNVPHARSHLVPTDTRGGKRCIIPQSCGREHRPPNTFISDLWTLELLENKCLMLQANKLVVIGYSSHRELIPQLLKK